MVVWIEIGMFVVSAIGVILAWIHFSEQQKLDFFARYTGRYQQIIMQLPEYVYQDHPIAEDACQQILPIMRAYYDLCSEEYFLYEQKYLSKKVWKEWRSGMEYIFQRPVFKQCWEKMDLQDTSYSNFREFVRKEIYQID